MPPKTPKTPSKPAPKTSKASKPGRPPTKSKTLAAEQQPKREPSPTPAPGSTLSASKPPPSLAVPDDAAQAIPNEPDNAPPEPPDDEVQEIKPPPSTLQTSIDLHKYLLKKYTSTTDFTQSDLLALRETPKDMNILMGLLNELLRKYYVQSFKSSTDDTLIFRVRTVVLAESIRSLTQQEEAIYNKIADVGSTGIWTRALKGRTQLHQTVLNRGLKVLESKKLIKQVRNNREGGKKMYMLQELKAEDEAKGAGWYGEGELDTDLIENVAKLVVAWIESESWLRGTKPQKDKDKDKARETDTARKRKRDDTDFDTTTTATTSAQPSSTPATTLQSLQTTSLSTDHRGRELLPHPPNHTAYPTASNTLQYLESTAILQDKDLAISDIQVLLDMLVFDGRLERVRPFRPSSTTHASLAAKKQRHDRKSKIAATTRKMAQRAARRAKRKAALAAQKERLIKPDPDGDLAPALLAANEEPKIKVEEASDDEAGDEDEPMYRSVRVPDVDSAAGRAGERAERDKRLKKLKEVGGDAGDEEMDIGSIFNYRGPLTPFAEVPCGRCPVFRLCAQSGPVNAEECGYLGDWLEI